MIREVLGDVAALYLIIFFLAFLEAESNPDLAFVPTLASAVMWPVTLYKACKAYVKELK